MVQDIKNVKGGAQCNTDGSVTLTLRTDDKLYQDRLTRAGLEDMDKAFATAAGQKLNKDELIGIGLSPQSVDRIMDESKAALKAGLACPKP